jgi:hypothetical protein
MRVLVACEESGTVRDEFIKLGHDAWSCDLKPARNGGNHFQCSVWDIINDGWDLMIAHPPCTYLTVTANKWLKDQPERKSGALVGAARRQAQKEAMIFFKKFWHVNIPMICIENPVGVMSSQWRKPDQIIQPWQFGHKEPKQTCLWLKNLPLLKPTCIVEPEYHTTASGKRLPKWYAYADKSEGQEKRAEIRSVTFKGIAEAMATQWSYITVQQLQLAI